MSSSPGEQTQVTDVGRAVLDMVRELSPSAPIDLGPDAQFVADLGFDSLGLVELLVALEDTLDLPPLSADVLGGMERVADLQRVIGEAQARMPQEETA